MCSMSAFIRGASYTLKVDQRASNEFEERASGEISQAARILLNVGYKLAEFVM